MKKKFASIWLSLMVSLLLYANGFAQNNIDETIEKFLCESDRYSYESDNLKSLKFAKKAYDLAVKNNNEEYIAISCFNIASTVSILGLHENALTYIEEGRKYCPKNDNILLAKFESIEALVFFNLGLFNESLKNYYSIIKRIKDENQNLNEKEVLFGAYQDIATNFAVLKKRDSVEKYNRLAKKIIVDLTFENDYHTIPIFYYNLGSDYLDNNQPDSAFVMFSKCRATEIQYNKPYLYMGYFGFSKYYRAKNPQKSLENYLKGIKIVENLQLTNSDFTNIYKDIADLYARLEDTTKQKEYINKYHIKLEYQEKNKPKAIEKAVSIILDKNEKQLSISRYKILVILGVIIIIFIAFIYVFIRKARIKSNQFNHELDQKDEVVKILTHKVNESFPELIDLAKKNSQQFWFRFQEIYPEFMTKMLALNSNLKVTELTYCAYIYLGFSNKEIANHTFKAIRTIENNRYNLRKKLKIKAEDSFAIWIVNYLDKKENH